MKHARLGVTTTHVGQSTGEQENRLIARYRQFSKQLRVLKNRMEFLAAAIPERTSRLGSTCGTKNRGQRYEQCFHTPVRISQDFAFAASSILAEIDSGILRVLSMTMAPEQLIDPHGFFQKQWLGEYSFPRSFWLHAILLSWFAPILALSLLSLNPWHIPGRIASVAFLAICMIFYPLLWWGMFGAARAGKLYAEKGGRRIWVTAATLTMAFLFMDSVYFFLGRTAMVMEHVRMAFTGRYGPPASVTLIENGSGLRLAGELREGSADAFALAISKSFTVSNLVLDSKGGLFQEATLLAKSVSQHGLDTYVEGECSSACTLVFLAGTRRCTAEGARIGFHAASYQRDLARKTSQDAADYERNLYRQAGLPATFIDRIMETPNWNVWYPSHQELREAGVTSPNCP